jgi:sugar O-acyltransferase (sialic acid O-acetyltransferase NeuD family)
MATKSIIILAGGGHARVVADLIHAAKAGTIKGYLDIKEAANFPVPYLGNDTMLKKLDLKKVFLANGLGSVDIPKARQHLFAQAKTLGFRFITLVHPFTSIASDVKLGEGTVVMAGVVIQTGSTIGDNVIINSSASIDHDARIGSHTHIAPGVTLSGGVTIGSGSHVGTGAVIIQGITIGDNALIAAGSVVTKSVSSGARMAGVPAKAKGKS